MKIKAFFYIMICMKNGLLPVLLLVLLTSCSGGPEKRNDRYEVTAGGRLVELGMTVWMYGTHGLVDSDTGEYLYALTSDPVDLELFEGSEVTVRGNLVEGYPVDTGPPYLEVFEVEP
jgi:hypothetical protein